MRGPVGKEEPSAAAGGAADEREDLRSLGGPVWVLSALFVAVLALAAATVTIVVGMINKPSAPSALHEADHAVTRSEVWMAANLPAGTRLLTDVGVQLDLAAQDSRLLTSLYPQGIGSSAVLDYVVSTPDLRTGAGLGDSAVAKVLRDSVPVAVFGSGSEQVQVRQLGAAPSTVSESRRVVDAGDRKLAGRGLLANPEVHADRAAGAVLAAGRLDLRAATVLAILADRTGIQLRAMPVDPAEAAAAMPARVVTLIARDPKQLAALLPTLPPPYRPQSVRSNADGSSTLTWTPIIAPVMPAT
jgi:hypothetical protein